MARVWQMRRAPGKAGAVALGAAVAPRAAVYSGHRKKETCVSAKPLVILQHDPDDPPAGIGTALSALGVPFEVRRLHEGDALPAWPLEAAGFISLGGAMHVHETHRHAFLAAEVKLLRRVIHAGGPVWGVCLGAQLVAQAAGGDVYKLKTPEVGWVSVEKEADDPLLQGVSSPFTAFCWHEYACTVPTTSHLIASSAQGVQVFRAGGRAWATQFHPELDAVTAPHWVEDAAEKHAHLGEEWRRSLREDTEKNLTANAVLCRRITENFVLASGLPHGA
jgi:GMP synthase-like glutamine amidotransferase